MLILISLKASLTLSSLETTALFLDNDNIRQTYNRSLHINLVIDVKIIDHYKSFNFLLFIKAIKINEIKLTLNTFSKASKELQLL